MKSIVKIVRKYYRISEKEAIGLVEAVSFESSEVGSGKSATDYNVVKDTNGLTRRNMILGLVVGAGGTGLGAFSLLPDIAKETIVSTVSGFLGETISDVLKDKTFSFDQKFISFLNQNRQHPDLPSIVNGTLQDEEKEIIRYLDTFRQGHHLNIKQASRLKDMLRHAADPSTKLIVADLLTSQLLRSGTASESKVIFDEVNPLELTGPDERIIFVEKSLSHAYASLHRDLAISPQEWKLKPALEYAEVLGLSEIGVQIARRQRRFEVTVPAGVKIPTKGLLAGVKGFYIIHIILLFWSAGLIGEDLRDAADTQMSALEQHVKTPGLQRAVWNAAFTIGLQYHRKGLASGNSFGEFALRDGFFDICFNKRKNFWPQFTDRVSDERLSADDPAAISMVLMIASDASTGLRKRYPDVAGAGSILTFRQAIKSVAIRKAVDQIRLRAGYGITNEEELEIYSADDRTLEVYLPPLTEIRSSVVL